MTIQTAKEVLFFIRGDGFLRWSDSAAIEGIEAYAQAARSDEREKLIGELEAWLTTRGVVVAYQVEARLIKAHLATLQNKVDTEPEKV